MSAIKWEIKQITELRGHLDRVWAVAWNPKRSLIVSCSGDKTVRLYSYYTLPISEETSDILLPDIDSPPPMKLVFTLSSAILTGVEGEALLHMEELGNYTLKYLARRRTRKPPHDPVTGQTPDYMLSN